MSKINVACIIDDDPIFVRVVTKMMEMSNFCNNIKVYRNGREALDHLNGIVASDSPDIIFLDLNMPIMNGWAFLDAYDQLNLSGNIQLYVVSSSIDPAEKEKARSYEFVLDFIEKPMTLKVFRDILCGACDETTPNIAASSK